MRAVVYPGIGVVPTMTEVPDPVCPDDGVVIDVDATGLCRSDWHAWRGHDPVSLPHIPGHEFAGTIRRVGRSVTHWQAGARVTAPFVCGCGRCAWCAAGETQVCPDQTQPGFTGPGSFAEQVVVHAADTNLVALPDEVDPIPAASLGCRVATAFRALTAHGRLAAGDHLAVHGCGGVGLSAVMIGVALGASVIAIDASPAAVARALELGAALGIEAGPGLDVAAAVRDATKGGAQVSIDAVGAPATAAASVDCLCRRGRHVQVGLLLGADARPPLPMDRVVAYELELHGSHGMAARDYPDLLELVRRGVLQPGLLVGRVIGLADAGAALAAMDGPPDRAGITVIVPNR